MRLRTLRIVYGRRPVQDELHTLRLRTPSDALTVFRRLLESEPVEVFGVICLSTKQEVIGYHEVSRGCLNATIVHPREVFKAAVLSNAAAIIAAHNHPSGDPTPSVEDVQLTERLTHVGALLGIDFLDHIVIGHGTRYFSFRESGRL